ncbi:unnamed protein product, partial [Ectocarpus sp. 13 AM-2016]
ISTRRRREKCRGVRYCRVDCYVLAYPPFCGVPGYSSSSVKQGNKTKMQTFFPVFLLLCPVLSCPSPLPPPSPALGCVFVDHAAAVYTGMAYGLCPLWSGFSVSCTVSSTQHKCLRCKERSL